MGALEPQFFGAFVKGLGVDDPDSLPDDPLGEEMKRFVADRFSRKTRAEWEAIFDGVDACVTPVLGRDEAASFSHNADRKSFHDKLGIPLPAPKLDRTPAVPEDFRWAPFMTDAKRMQVRLVNMGRCLMNIFFATSKSLHES